MTLAEPTGLWRLLGEKVHIGAPRIKSGSANPAPKLATVVAGMCAGADCIDVIDVVRSGGMKALFDGVYEPSTIGMLLWEFTFRHARQLESVLSAAAMCLLRQAGPEVPVLAAGSCRFGCAAVVFDAGDIVHGESYCQDRNISSAKATVFFTEGGLAMPTNHAEQPWALSNRTLCGVSQFVQGSPAHPGVSSAVQMLHPGRVSSCSGKQC